MKKFVTAVATLALVGASYGASLKQGTQEIVVQGGYDPQTANGDTEAISLEYGQFIQDLIEVGVRGNYGTDENVETYGLGAFAEYNFDLAGVKYFLAENVAISADAEIDWADDEIYPKDEDFDDTNFQFNLGMRFFIP